MAIPATFITPSGQVLALSLNKHFKTFNDKTLSDRLLSDPVTYIPRSDKLHDNFKKNWRSITLLINSYNFLSGVLANRIKPKLPKLIHSDLKSCVA